MQSKSNIRLTRKTSQFAGISSTTFARQSAIPRFLPTYRLEPTKKFNRETCGQIMKKVLAMALNNFKYTPRKAQILSRHISEEIQTRIKLQNYDRYKIICVVTIGQKYFQGYHSSLRCLCDADRDQYVNEVYDTPNFFCVATLYAFYYD